VHILAETSVHAHDLLVNQGDQGHVVEAVVKRLPQRYFVPPFDFVEESVDASDSLTLVVATQNDNLCGISNL